MIFGIKSQKNYKKIQKTYVGAKGEIPGFLISRNHQTSIPQHIQRNIS